MPELGPMLVRLAAAIAFVVFLWSLFRFAMGLRFAKLSREEARQAQEARGRRVVTEIPTAQEDLILFLEDHEGFYWGAEGLGKSQVRGARLLLNGGVLGSFCRDAAGLPDPPPPEDDEGKERWEVTLYLADGASRSIPCGTLREGVSREIATKVFDAVRGIFPAGPGAS